MGPRSGVRARALVIKMKAMATLHKSICLLFILLTLSNHLALATETPTTAPHDPIRVVVWDEQQPGQKPAYDNFLGNAIADYLRTRSGLTVRSVRLDDPEQGMSDDVLSNADVLIWWGHIRNRDVSPKVGQRVADRIKAGKLALIALHSAHWSKPFIAAMNEKTTEEAIQSLPEDQRKTTQLSFEFPMIGIAPRRDAPLTPSWRPQKNPDGSDWLIIKLPNCCFPAYRADGKPGHLKTLLPDHPIAAGIPAEFDIPQTEMYDEPFHIPAPDSVIFEEHWDAGDHFRSGMLWKVGQGMVFYFRPGHEAYPVYRQAIPLKILENAVRYLDSQLPKDASVSKPQEAK